MTLLLLPLWIGLVVAEASSECSINGDTAWCGVRNLSKVPPLPHHVTKVDLSLNYIGEIHEESFGVLEALQILELEQQEVPLTIRNSSFSRLSGLTELHLGYNHFLQLEPGAFEGLFNLKKLDLTQCNLDDSILSGDFLRPLVSLEELILKDNKIGRIRPASFFVSMRRFHALDISQNWINSLCEKDLWGGFRGKHFTSLNLRDIKLSDMNPFWSGWNDCGNPFRDMSITTLDLSQNGFSVEMAVRFFRAIRGTKIHFLILNQSGSMGKGVMLNNLKDPDNTTFQDLAHSGVTLLDLSRASIFALTNSVFSSMPDLEGISLARNVINQIQTGAFYGLKDLKLLNLAHNLVDKIGPETFENLPNLEVLDLSHNNIRMLLPGSFKGLANLLLLNLTENSLQRLHTLATLPRLQLLYLGMNMIESLYGLPNRTGSASIIDLRSNRFRNLEDLYAVLVDFPNIQLLYLGDNSFLWCHHNRNYSVSPLNGLKTLDLHMTGLQNLWAQGKCLDMFDNLHQLEALFLEKNYMQWLPDGVFKGLTSLTRLDLSFNSLTYLPRGVFPLSLRILDLRFNLLSSVDPHALSSLTHLNLFGNQFICDCSLRDFQLWLNQTDVWLDVPVSHLLCEFPQEQRGIPLMDVEIPCEGDEDEESIEKLRLTLFICCTVTVTLIAVGTVVFVCLRGFCFKLYRKAVARLVEGAPREPEDNGFAYDVYLCFSSKDIKWVTRALLKKLDSQFSDRNTLRCCFEARDFLPGEDHLSNMHNAVCKSKKTLCVLSREFLKDGWCLEAFSLAQSKMLEDVRDALLVLLVDNIPFYRLMKYETIRTYIQTRRYFCWPEDSQDLEWFYSQLQHSILKDVKVKQEKKHDQKANQPNHEAVTCV